MTWSSLGRPLPSLGCGVGPSKGPVPAAYPCVKHAQGKDSSPRVAFRPQRVNNSKRTDSNVWYWKSSPKNPDFPLLNKHTTTTTPPICRFINSSLPHNLTLQLVSLAQVQSSCEDAPESGTCSLAGPTCLGAEHPPREENYLPTSCKCPVLQ